MEISPSWNAQAEAGSEKPQGDVQLPHTLQTWCGMIMDGGAPGHRSYMDEVADTSIPRNSSGGSASLRGCGDCEKFAAEYIESSKSRIKNEACDPVLLQFAGNLAAITNNVTLGDLKRFTTSRTRLDLEQAAAVVISAFVTEGRLEAAKQLVPEVSQLLRSAYMWIDPYQRLPQNPPAFVSPVNLGKKIQASAASKDIKIPLATSYAELVPLLMRVRRCKPDDRCLKIPQWMFEEAGIAPPAHFRALFDNRDRTQYPVAPREQDAIVVSRKHFRCQQRHMYHYYQYWKPEVDLRKRIKKLEDDVIYGQSSLQSQILSVNDVGLLSHYFFALQRRLQCRAVGWLGRGFFAKGEGATYYQNNRSIKSTFEKRLLEIAESNEEGVIVAMGKDDTLARIDETCLLMKRYVDVYGGGVKDNLTFKKGVSGGSGRGPVDFYNLLCDVLMHLKDQARDEGIVDVPGHVQKFLAKDIMAWNNAWKDDAFACGRIPGWEEWLQKRAVEDFNEWDIVIR
ncbi:hypothetical protein FB567DRAFT_555508 [Paraphoma chrysanthemicola]|uniref:Uncharacterized protein n=1 Tax=Paraphoma chrysanthemicola TaxID=798071 RepID=A0A8K0QTX8_9PLEO|nr:hypothetical protein FB567DRAFT_555508 [Paraphoma chrysanthemicola]